MSTAVPNKADACPSCPFLHSPQPNARPASSMQTVWPAPHATYVIRRPTHIHRGNRTDQGSSGLPFYIQPVLYLLIYSYAEPYH